MKTITKKEYMLFGFVLIFNALLVFAWFSPLNYHVFMGDDLFWIKAYRLGVPLDSFWSSIFTIGNDAGKFRPVTIALMLMATGGVCQDSYNCFIGINFVMITVNAFLASVIAYKLTFRWMPSVFITSTVIILSRFSYYAALQVMGIMENLAMTFVLLLVLCFIYFMRSAKVKWMAIIIILFLLILLTHERFIVMLLPILFSLLVKRKDLKTSQFAFLLSALVLVTSGYFLIRGHFLHTMFLTGAGSTSIVDTFNTSQVMIFINNGIINLLGFNAGPDYLSGKYFLDIGLRGIIVGLFLSGTLVVLLYMYLKQQKYKKIEVGLVLVLILMIGGMVFASSITFRQEYRWLYTPFAVFILLVCYFLSKLENIKVKYVMAILVAVSFTSVDIFYRPYMHNLYLISSEQLANSVKMEIIDKYNQTELAQKAIFLLIENDVVKTWILDNDFFFELYAQVPEINVNYVKDLNEIPMESIYSDHLLVFSLKGTQVTDITQNFLQNRIDLSRYIIGYDFVSNFPSAIWEKDVLVTTPNGHVAFLMPWQDNFGLPINTITLVSPYDILFPSIPCKEGSRLIFSVGIPNTSSDGADLSVDMESEGKQKKLLNVSLEPAEMDGVVTWSDYVVPLTDCAEKTIAIKFAESSPSGNPSADWIAITNVKLVSPK